MPGVTIAKSGPQRCRMSAVSCGDATTPSRPGALGELREPQHLIVDRCRRRPFREHRRVHARQHRDGDDERRRPPSVPPRSRAASRAALHHPRAARRVHVHHPDAERRRGRAPPSRRCSGCRGTSGRGRRGRRARRASRTIDGPFGGEEPAADLEAAGDAAQLSASASARAAVLDVERDQELIHAVSSWLVSSVPSRSASRAMPWRSM